MSIINSSYFVSDLYLPQVGEGASSIVNNEGSLNEFITIYEPEILTYALGSKLYSEFIQHIQQNGTISASADQKWNDLLNGIEYEKNGITHFWKGIVRPFGTFKKSFIANYVWYKYVYDSITQHTTLGIVKADAENSKTVSANRRLTDVWRDMIDWYGGTIEGNSVTCFSHGNYHFEDHFNGHGNTKEVSLYTFLSDHSDNYPGWYFTPLENKNEWGL
ncbi:DUF6712 family protein [Spongiimicrobium salis]|uniref:DUF6712 family protein n=1 Tax=Spongiimicrobium salis TaxID=1667022 RepID=UPI00374D4D74